MESVVLCPSVFGAYPKASRGTHAVNVSGGNKNVRCKIGERQWESGHFTIEVSLCAGRERRQMVFSGGATTPRGLSQGLLSQCLKTDFSDAFVGLVIPEAFADFLFDQLVPEEMKAIVRQEKGVMGAPWLSVDDIQESFLMVDAPALLLGEVLRHPAAYMAPKWLSAEPLGGVAGKVPPRFAELLSRSARHFQAGGYLVVGPTVAKGRSEKPPRISFPLNGCIITGRRAGVEALAREQARRQGRPLMVVSRQDEADPILLRGLFQHIIADTSRKPLGSFRQKMVDMLHGGQTPPLLAGIA